MCISSLVGNHGFPYSENYLEIISVDNFIVTTILFGYPIIPKPKDPGSIYFHTFERRIAFLLVAPWISVSTASTL